MIDPFTDPQIAARPDAAYKSWADAGKRAMMRHDLNDRTAGPMPSFGLMVHDNNLTAMNANAYSPGGHDYAAAGKPDIAYAGDSDADEFSFDDVIDMINPLHHLPVVGMVYRKLTGDTIKPFSSIIGGAIFGGPVGAVSSTVNAIVKDQTGRDVAENAFALAGFDIAPAAPKTPHLDYIKPVAAAPFESQHREAANQYERTSSGSRNFSSAHKHTHSWNA